MHRATCPTAVMLSLLFVVALPVSAGTVRVSDVSQTVPTAGANAWGTQLRLRGVSEATNLFAGSRPGTQNSSGTQQKSGNTPATTSGVAISQDTSSPNIETIELGDVTGTVCDCGEIAVPILPIIGGGGFPLYPLLALGAIPLAFLDFDNDSETFATPGPTPPPVTNPVPTPTPGPSPAPIPEPATLFLLGSGLVALGAKARRRRNGRLVESHQQDERNGAEV